MYRPRQHSVQHNDKTGTERWLISYADYMTLLFALFVVLFSLSSLQKEQFETLSQTLAGLFNPESSASSVPAGDSPVPAQAPQTPFELDATGVEPEDKGPTLLNDSSELQSVEQTRLGSPLAALETELRQSLADLTEQGLATVQRDDDWLTIELSSTLLFSSGSANPNRAAVTVMAALTELLQKHQNYIRVRGYTDSEPIHNELFPSNWELSVARATAILRLLELNGIVAGRMAVEGYGQYSPFASNLTAAGRAENRKVVIAVSRYAYQPPAAETDAAESEVQTPPDSLSPGVASEQSEEAKVRVIRLPHGGIRITTRQPQPGEAEEPPTQQEN